MHYATSILMLQMVISQQARGARKWAACMQGAPGCSRGGARGNPFCGRPSPPVQI